MTIWNWAFRVYHQNAVRGDFLSPLQQDDKNHALISGTGQGRTATSKRGREFVVYIFNYIHFVLFTFFLIRTPVYVDVVFVF